MELGKQVQGWLTKVRVLCSFAFPYALTIYPCVELTFQFNPSIYILTVRVHSAGRMLPIDSPSDSHTFNRFPSKSTRPFVFLRTSWFRWQASRPSER